MGLKTDYRPLRFALMVGGSITCVIGIAHIFMPVYGYRESLPMEMASATREHFYYLGTYAICGFLLTLGGLSLYFSRMEHFKSSLFVGFLLSLFWVSRAILEIIYPVDVAIFILERPHLPLLSVILFLALAYTIGTVSGYATYRRRGFERFSKTMGSQ